MCLFHALLSLYHSFCFSFTLQRYGFLPTWGKKDVRWKMYDVRCIAPMGLKTMGEPSVYRGLSAEPTAYHTPTAKIYRPPMGLYRISKNNFLKDRKRPQFATSLEYFQSPQIRGGYFSNLRLSTSSRTLICFMAIWFRRFKRSRWGMPSLMNTALRFSRLERQISWLMVA